MKKYLSAILACTLLASVTAGCSSNNTASSSEPSSAASESQSSEPTETVISESSAPEQIEQSQIDKALALINTFASGDTETARELLDENYIQHNLAYGTGEEAFIGSVEYLASAEAPTTVENIRAFEDGDYVFLQTVYNFAGAGEQVAFDIFRFDEDGEIADGVSGLNEALAALAEQGIQMIYDETHMVLAQGNYVLAVSEGTYGGAPTSYYDLWRVENGKIAEHWDVMETIADESTWQNQNGKF